jgi:hypothetical protein
MIIKKIANKRSGFIVFIIVLVENPYLPLENAGFVFYDFVEPSKRDG